MLNPTPAPITHGMGPAALEEWRATKQDHAERSASKAQRRIERLERGMAGLHPTDHATALHEARRDYDRHTQAAAHWATWTPETQEAE